MSDSPKAPEAHQANEKPARKSITIPAPPKNEKPARKSITIPAPTKNEKPARKSITIPAPTKKTIGWIIFFLAVAAGVVLIVTNQKSSNSAPATNQSQQGQTGKGADSKTENATAGQSAQTDNPQQTTNPDARVEALKVELASLKEQLTSRPKYVLMRNADGELEQVPLEEAGEIELKASRARTAQLERELAEAQKPANLPPPATEERDTVLNEIRKELAESRKEKAEMAALFAQSMQKQPESRAPRTYGNAPDSYAPRSAAADPCASPAPICPCIDCQNGRPHGTTRVEVPCTTTPAATPSCNCQGGTYCSGNTNNWSFLNDLIDINIVGVGGGYGGGGYHTRHRTVEHHVVHHRPSSPPRCAPPPRCGPRPCPPNQRGPNPNGHRGNGNRRR